MRVLEGSFGKCLTQGLAVFANRPFTPNMIALDARCDALCNSLIAATARRPQRDVDREFSSWVRVVDSSLLHLSVQFDHRQRTVFDRITGAKFYCFLKDALEHRLIKSPAADSVVTCA
jgi:hypothetical protein